MAVIETLSFILLMLINLFSLLSVIWAILVLFRIFNQEESDIKRVFKNTFILFSIATIFLMLGEWTWSYHVYILGNDPYPSIGDLFYVLGYIFEAGGFIYLAAFSYNASKNKEKLRSWMSGALIIAVGASFYLLNWLIIPFHEWGSSLEAMLDLYYPIASSILLVSTIPAYLLFRGLKIEKPLLLIALSALFGFMGDFLFSYYSWNDIYGVIGILSDLFYTIDYLLLFLGLVLFARLLGSKKKYNASSDKPLAE